MSHQGSEGQQHFPGGGGQQHPYNRSSTNAVAIKQRNNLIVNPTIGIPQNNMIQNNAVALGLVQQQPQMPMLWKGQSSLVPNPGTTVSASNNQNHNQLPGPFASIVPSNGMIQMNTQVEPSPPIAPGSAPNIILAPEAIKNSEKTRASVRNAPTASKSKGTKTSKGNSTGAKGHSKDQNDIDGKTEKNRERNREHARSTRLRKKAYIQKLKDMAQGLRAIQTTEIRERRLSMENMMNIRKVRRAVVQTVLDYHVGNEQDPAKWNVLLESSFWMKQPVTPFRSFRRSEIDRDCRILRGTDSMICDAASIAVMIERIGSRNARWRRIKRSDFLNTLDDRDALTQEIGIPQQPESSLSSGSSSDSSQCSENKTTLKRKRAMQNTQGHNAIPKVSSSSESVQSPEKNLNSSSDGKTNTSSSDENEREISAKFQIPPPKVARTDNLTRQPPVLSRAYLNNAKSERITAFYAVNQDDMIVLEDVLMCPYVFRTNYAVSCGALADCVVPGMLRATFSKTNKLLSMELVFDAMGFMQQLDNANGEDSNVQAIPNSQETAILPCRDEARVITEARPPYSVVHVNESWTRLTKYSQVDAEGIPLFTLLQKKRIGDMDLEADENAAVRPGRVSHSLEDVQRGRPACSTAVHYDKNGKPFVDFMSSYPLTNKMDPLSRAPAIAQLPFGAPAAHSSTSPATESFIDGKSQLVADRAVAIQSTKATAPKKNRNPGERIQRSRERNRIHARKTRQRKKEQLQLLQNKAEQLKGEQINLKLSINEKNTANILCCLFSNNQGLQSSSTDDPRVEALLTRPEDEIPDPSKLPALQPLILPSGAQHSKRNGNDLSQVQKLPNDGIDYELLGKDRSKCTPAELDQIRRERNRMHAKRTRDRKRLFMEEMAEMCKVLEGENLILRQHLDELNGMKSKSATIASTSNPIPTSISSVPTVAVSPSLSPATPPALEPSDNRPKVSMIYRGELSHQQPVLPLTSHNGASFDQMKTLLDAAGVFDLNSTAYGHRNKCSSSCVVSVSSEDHTDHSLRPLKKRRQHNRGSSFSDEDGAGD